MACNLNIYFWDIKMAEPKMVKSKQNSKYLAPVPGGSDTPDPMKDPGITTVPRGAIKIIPIKCCNDWCFIIPFSNESTILIPSGADYRNIGVVIGRNDKLISHSGASYDNPLAIGRVVMFEKNSVVDNLSIMEEPYIGRTIILVSQRNIICELPSVPVEIMEGSLDAGANRLSVTSNKRKK